MSDVVIASNTSIKFGQKVKRSGLIVGGNGDSGRVMWYSAPATGSVNFSMDTGSFPTQVAPENVIPYVKFSTAGGGSNNRESLTQVWIDNVLIYNNYQTNGASTEYTILLPEHSGFSLAAGTTIEYRLYSFKDIGFANARAISTGHYNPALNTYTSGSISGQEFTNSP
jgi:hypothetical protein